MCDTQSQGRRCGLIVAILLAGVLVAVSVVAAAWMTAWRAEAESPRFQMVHVNSASELSLYMLDVRTGALWRKATFTGPLPTTGPAPVTTKWVLVSPPPSDENK